MGDLIVTDEQAETLTEIQGALPFTGVDLGRSSEFLVPNATALAQALRSLHFIEAEMGSGEEVIIDNVRLGDDGDEDRWVYVNGNGGSEDIYPVEHIVGRLKERAEGAENPGPPFTAQQVARAVEETATVNTEVEVVRDTQTTHTDDPEGTCRVKLDNGLERRQVDRLAEKGLVPAATRVAEDGKEVVWFDHTDVDDE